MVLGAGSPPTMGGLGAEGCGGGVQSQYPGGGVQSQYPGASECAQSGNECEHEGTHQVCMGRACGLAVAGDRLGDGGDDAARATGCCLGGRRDCRRDGHRLWCRFG